MLKIKSIQLRNFLSYGDYETKLELSDLGPVLILGQIDEEGSSNGAGKSSLLSAFVWCLFGRTVTNHNPGDKVINWFSKENCYVKLETEDGWEIIRTRKCQQYSELNLLKDGIDHTLSTTEKTQDHLNDLFNLDYDIFISSIFCGQFSRSFLELTSTKRKEAIERLIGLDKINLYATRAKEKCRNIEISNEKNTEKLKIYRSSLDDAKMRLEKLQEKSKNFIQKRENKVVELESAKKMILTSLSSLTLPNHDKLNKQWEEIEESKSNIEQIKNKIKSCYSQIDLIEQQISTIKIEPSNYEFYDLESIKKAEDNYQQGLEFKKKLEDSLRLLKSKLDDLNKEKNQCHNSLSKIEDKIGVECDSCGQMVGEEYASKVKENFGHKLSDLTSSEVKINQSYDLLKSKLNSYSNLKLEISYDDAKRHNDFVEKVNSGIESNRKLKLEMEDKIQNLNDQILEFKDKLESLQKIDLTPSMSKDEYYSTKSKIDSLSSKLELVEDQIDKLINSENPYIDLINEAEQSIVDVSNNIDSLEEEKNKLNLIFSHLKYIEKSYSDRRKIKKWLFSEVIPYLNDRIGYYLDLFAIDIGLSFTSSLSDKTDKWNYEFCSGGERKKIDLSIMFALYDLYIAIHGNQYNFMVLDEVDSRLDAHGVQVFSDIVTNDLSKLSLDAIFVISHKSELKDLIPNQIVISKVDNDSKLSKINCES